MVMTAWKWAISFTVRCGRMFSLLGFSDAGPGRIGFLLGALGYGVTLPARRS
jgi:hypothetical protein